VDSEVPATFWKSCGSRALAKVCRRSPQSEYYQN